MPESLNNAQKVLVRLIRNQLPSQACEVIKQLHEADIAELFRYFTRGDKETYIQLLIETDKITTVLGELDEETFPAIREHLSDTKLVSILQKMPTDDAADIINILVDHGYLISEDKPIKVDDKFRKKLWRVKAYSVSEVLL